VLARGRTAYVEDMSLRPDLTHPPAAASSGCRGGLGAGGAAAGGGLAGRDAGAVRTKKTAWDEEQVALAESLAAQAFGQFGGGAPVRAVAQERQRLETLLRTVPFGIKVATPTPASSA
jgi:hypothetical protein